MYTHAYPQELILRGIVIACLMLVSIHASAQRADLFAADAFGYQSTTGTSCDLQWVDISASGQLLSFEAAATAAADDDGGVVLELSEPFEFYDAIYQQLLVSTNGYVAFTTSLTAENGGDFSNDCPLPAVPENGAADLARIAVLHDDLTAGSNGQVFYAYQANCTRAGLVSSEACTIIQWQDWDYRQPSGEMISFQLLLYHQSRAIVSQYLDVATIGSASATIGIQNASLHSAHMLNCNAESALPPTGAWCITHPLNPEQMLVSGFEARL